ncbi:MAG: 16S rRNA (guanine1207-N2)-methyltransferase [Alteromonadaceae bacterium]|jgi:16S rRNA (guanine1207-N2)-methyltransferase
MSLTNTSQLLLRNFELLNAKEPLFINLLPDDFTQTYLTKNPTARVTSYNTHFEYYQQHKLNKQVNCVFSAHYQTKIKHDLVILQFPKSKTELNFTLTMISEHLTSDAKILVVGENKSGIKSIDKLTQKTLTSCNNIDAARHCLLFLASISLQAIPFDLNNWYQYYTVEFDNIHIKVAALPGVFSQKALDKGSAVLLENLPHSFKGQILDFGCGAGVIASYIGKKFPETQLSLLDVNALAINSAEKTLAINNLKGHVFASDSLSEVTKKYDHVVSNPPFHQGKQTNYVATERFLSEIKRFLVKQGDVIIVANSFLRYQPIMEQFIGKTIKVCSKNGFTVYSSKQI